MLRQEFSVGKSSIAFFQSRRRSKEIGNETGVFLYFICRNVYKSLFLVGMNVINVILSA